MEIKGSAVKSIPDYLKKFHADKYSQWINGLPEPSKKIFTEAILPSSWYPLRESAVIPTEMLGKLLFNDPVRGARECGRFSAETALTGIYKFFIRAATPQFIIERAGKILSTYYQPCTMKVAEKGEEYVVLHITQFEEPDELVENRIAGWMERAMEIHGVEQLTVNITQSLTKGDPVTEIQVRWSKAAKA